MSGISGCWHFDALPVSGVEVERSLAQLPPIGPDGVEYWLDGPVAIGHKSFGSPRPLEIARPTDRSVAVFEGRLDSRLDLCRTLHDHQASPDNCHDSHLIADAYDRFGDAFIEHVDGDFALAVFDRRRKRLLLARDRLGLRPLCYTRTKGRLLFASDAKALLAYPGVNAIPDEKALADFFLYFLAADAQTHTFFQGIDAVPPGHLLIASPEGVSVRRYFEFDTTRQIRLGGVRNYAAALNDLFTASVRKRLRSDSPVAVSVSGGLDSSYIFCVADRLVRREPGVSPAVLGFYWDGAPRTPSDESRFVEALEGACHSRIERVSELPGFVERAAEDVWHSESPRVDLLARQGWEARNRVREAGAVRFLTGHWGDQLLSDSDYLLDLLRSGHWRALKRHADRWRVSAPRLAARFSRDLVARHAPSSMLSAIRVARPRDGAWQTPWFTPRFRGVLRERFLAERMPTIPGTHHARAIHRQSRLPYHVHCMEWNVRVGAGHGLDIAFPYLDRDLIQFLMSIPGDMQSYDGVQRGLMREAMRGTVPDAIIERRDKGEFTHLGPQSIERDFSAIRDLLGPSAASVRLGYVDGPVLWKQLEQWRTLMGASSNVLTSRITDLCGLELLLRRFFPDPASNGAHDTVPSC